MTKLKFILVLLLLTGSTLVASASGRNDVIRKEVLETNHGLETLYFIDGIEDFALESVNYSNGTIMYDISMDDQDQRLVSVVYNPVSPKKTKLMVKNKDTDDKYYYNVYPGEEAVIYPIQFGDGQYEIKLYENTSGSSYRRIYAKTYHVEVEDSLSVFLTSHLEMNWNDEDDAILLANELVLDLQEAAYRDEHNISTNKELDEASYMDFELDDMVIIEAFYDFVIHTVAYDYDKIESLSYDYLPDIDVTLEDESGICYDYSTLFGSMLRSQGIPAKLIKGYTSLTDAYHAWNQVYFENDERWVVIDTTFDAYYLRNDEDFQMVKDADIYETHKYY